MESVATEDKVMKRKSKRLSATADEVLNGGGADETSTKVVKKVKKRVLSSELSPEVVDSVLDDEKPKRLKKKVLSTAAEEQQLMNGNESIVDAEEKPKKKLRRRTVGEQVRKKRAEMCVWSFFDVDLIGVCRYDSLSFCQLVLEWN
jgi:hypothetical protein